MPGFDDFDCESWLCGDIDDREIKNPEIQRVQARSDRQFLEKRGGE
jgi:hypothetical protein